jgi:translation elongation factor EF-4
VNSSWLKGHGIERRMHAFRKIEIPKESFVAALRMDRDQER